MQTELPEQAKVDAFLPLLELPHRLTNKPRTVGGLDCPHETEAHRAQMQEAFDRVPVVYREVQREFARAFGRPLADAVVPYRADDADFLLVAMGTLGATARRVVDEARAKGVRVGSARILQRLLGAGARLRGGAAAVGRGADRFTAAPAARRSCS